MLREDIKRIREFCDRFEVSADDLFGLLGTGLCQQCLILLKAGNDYSDFAEMESYIYNDLKKRGVINEN